MKKHYPFFGAMGLFIFLAICAFHLSVPSAYAVAFTDAPPSRTALGTGWENTSCVSNSEWTIVAPTASAPAAYGCGFRALLLTTSNANGVLTSQCYQCPNGSHICTTNAGVVSCNKPQSPCTPPAHCNQYAF